MTPLFVKAKKDKDPNHLYSRLPVFRKNYDFGTGYTKMVDEFRDGKIKDVHDFIEEKRKEPSPIKDWKEKRKKRKKKVKKADMSLDTTWRWEWIEGTAFDGTGSWKLIKHPRDYVSQFLQSKAGMFNFIHPKPEPTQYGFFDGRNFVPDFDEALKTSLLDQLTRHPYWEDIEEGDTFELLKPDGQLIRYSVEPGDLVRIGEKENSLLKTAINYWSEFNKTASNWQSLSHGAEAILDQAEELDEYFKKIDEEAQKVGDAYARALEQAAKNDNQAALDALNKKRDEVARQVRNGTRGRNTWRRIRGGVAGALTASAQSHPNIWFLSLYSGYVMLNEPIFIPDITNWDDVLDRIHQKVVDLGKLNPRSDDLVKHLVPNHDLVQGRTQYALLDEREGQDFGSLTLQRGEGFDDFFDQISPGFFIAGTGEWLVEEGKNVRNWFQTVRSFAQSSSNREKFAVGERLKAVEWGGEINEATLKSFEDYDREVVMADEWAQKKSHFEPPLTKKAVSVIVEPYESLVVDAVNLVSEKMPGLFEQAKVQKIILEPGSPSHFGQVNSAEPGVIRVSLEKIKAAVQNGPKEEIVNRIGEVLSHELGHLLSGFQGGEGPAEQKENQFLSMIGAK